MTQIKLRRDTSANFTSKNPVLGVGEPAYETDTKKLKIGDGTTAYNSLTYFTTTDDFATYREKYGAPADSIPVVNTGNSITIKAGVNIETPNGTLTNATDMTYTYDFTADRVLFVTENDYYHAFAVYYGGREPSPVGEQIFWFNNNVWTMISGDGTKTTFSAQKITPIAKIYQTNSVVKNIDYSSFTKISGGGSTNISATLPLKIVDGVISLEVDGQTILIVDGKLHANLDELGNEVNTLAGDVAGVQADLLNKQDKFETQVPLSISNSSITTSVATGITETSESWTGGDHDKLVTVDVSALNVDANSDWKIHLSGYMGNYYATSTNTNVLFISAEKNTIFRVWFGSQYFRIGNSTSKFEKIPGLDREFFYEIVHQKNGTEFTFHGTNLVDPTPLPISVMSSKLGQTSYTTLAGQGKLKDFAFLINSYQFQRIDRDISKSYFEADGVRYRLTSVKGTNTLNLNIGSGLAITDGKLTASSTAPTNMVTTDTEQTISGNKELTGITTISNDIKFTIGKKITTPDGEWLMQLGPGSIGIGTSMKPLKTYDGSNYYLHNKSIIAGDGIKITEPNSSEIEISSTNTTPVRYPVEVSDKSLLPSWYVVYNDGWCEQGGRYTINTDGSGTITFLKEFVNTSYTIFNSKESTDSSTWTVMFSPAATWTTSQVDIKANLTGYKLGGSWEAKGYIK